MQRSLTALKAVQSNTGACGLALAAARRRLALARADPAPDPFRAIVRPGIVPDLVELHRLPDPCAVGANPTSPTKPFGLDPPLPQFLRLSFPLPHGRGV